ncbi:TPM domain-containing protein [Novosphingobium tardum]|uniref:TPM domain-containing protein n=1 Tax=Novosphingobium tardum TaxID=1538021 RepID=A0ABV8RRK6_9SPHN
MSHPSPAMLSDADHDRVSAAVSSAEGASAGEIVTILTDRSDGYTDVALAWAAFAAFTALVVLSLFPAFYLGLFDRVAGTWASEWTSREVFALAATVAMLKFLGTLLIQLWQPLKFFLVPPPVKSGRVRGRAVTCFKVGAERRTHGRTGILIYLSMREHRAEIVADEAIASKVAPEVWGEAMAAMLAELRRGNVADGVIAAVERVGAILAQHFPRHENDVNELPDRLIEV